MKFVAVKQIDNGGLEKIRIVPPCRGYYTNLSIQNVIGTAGDWPDGSLTELYDWFLMGVNIDDGIFTTLADVENEGEEGDLRIHPDLHPPNAIEQRFIDPGLRVADDESSDPYYGQYKHWGKKRLYVNNDTDLVEMFYWTSHDTPNNYILVQGDFIPKRGAIFKENINIGNIAVTDDFDTEELVFNQSLNNAQLKVTISALYSTQPYTAMLYFRKGKRGDVTFEDTADDGFGDILDEDIVDQSRWSMHGIIGAVKFGSKADAVGTIDEGVIDLGNINEGDYLSWDMRILVGTQGGGINVNCMLAGLVSRQEWCENAMFFENPHMYDINTDVNGVYTVL